jgi:hypothetical protein
VLLTWQTNVTDDEPPALRDTAGAAKEPVDSPRI